MSVPECYSIAANRQNQKREAFRGSLIHGGRTRPYGEALRGNLAAVTNQMRNIWRGFYLLTSASGDNGVLLFFTDFLYTRVNEFVGSVLGSGIGCGVVRTAGFA